MFVAKNELKNTAQLIRLKLSVMTSGAAAKSAIIIAAVFVLLSLISNISRLIRENDIVTGYKFHDFSSWLIIGLWAVIALTNSYYRQINRGFDVYPQTAVSRFLSTQALCYIWIIFAAVLSMFLYLIQYGMVVAIAAFRGNIYMIEKFDAGFVLTGFAAMIVFLFAFASSLALITALVRKFGFPAITVLAILAAIRLSNKHALFALFQKEPSLIRSVIISAVICLVLFALTFFVNKRTNILSELREASRRFFKWIHRDCHPSSAGNRQNQ